MSSMIPCTQNFWPGIHIYCHSMLLSLFTFSRVVPASQRLFQGSNFVQGHACECSRLETSLRTSWPLDDQNGIWTQVVLFPWRARCFRKENKVTRLVRLFRRILAPSNLSFGKLHVDFFSRRYRISYNAQA